MGRDCGEWVGRASAPQCGHPARFAGVGGQPGAGLGLGVPQGCWKGRHLPTFRGPDAARTWQASLWQEPAAPASVYLVRQTKLEKTPPPYATQNQRALQKRPVLPRRPLALTPRPRRGQAGAEQGPSGQLLKTRREGGLERASPLRSAGVCGVRDQRAPGEFRNGPALVAAPARPPKASPLPPRLQDSGRRAPAALPTPTHTRPGTGLRSHSTVMAVTAGLAPGPCHTRPVLAVKSPGVTSWGGVAGVSLLALGFFGFSVSERRTALVEGRPPLRLPPSLRRSELWWQVTEPQVGVVKAKCTPGPSKRRRGLGSASGAAAVRARVGPSSLQPCAPACPSASSWGGLQAVILPAETPRGEPVPGSGHQGPR